MVCLSGGKDSHALLDVLLSLRTKAPIAFDVIAVNLDQKQPGFPAHVLPEYLTGRGVPYRIVEQDTYSVVKRVIPEGKTMCSLCSRCGGVLYRVASELGATRRSRWATTATTSSRPSSSTCSGGKLKAMPPKLLSDDGKHVVIRPLAYVAEEELSEYAKQKAFPIIPCTLCGSQENLERKKIGEMLAEWQRRNPGRVESIVRALGDISASHLLDRKLFDFAALQSERPMPETTRRSSRSS